VLDPADTISTTSGTGRLRRFWPTLEWGATDQVGLDPLFAGEVEVDGCVEELVPGGDGGFEEGEEPAGDPLVAGPGAGSSRWLHR